MNNSPKGFSLWINSLSPNGYAEAGHEHLANALRREGWAVEVFNAEKVARDAYKGEAPPPGLALGLTMRRLNRHGIICIVAGGRAQPEQIHWGWEKPEKLLHLWCGDVVDSLPCLALRPEAFTSEGITSNGDPVGFVLAELERRGWLAPLEAEEAEDDPTVLPRLRRLGLL
ncbi:MAG: hypothetical protein V2A56_06135 [bacterium]